MHSGDRLGRRDWLAGAVLGAVLGLLLLGVGGRFAMRVIALLAGQTPGFSLGGTAPVIFLGTVWGGVGALVFVGLRFLTRRRVVRATLFWAFLVLMTLRGLRPIDVQRLAVFLPLVLLYGVALQVLWCRVYWPRRSSASEPPPKHGVAPYPHRLWRAS